MHIYTYLPTYIHTYIKTCIHTYTYTYVHTYIRKCIHSHIHICIHIYICACMRTYLHKYIIMHLYNYIRYDFPIAMQFNFAAFVCICVELKCFIHDLFGLLTFALSACGYFCLIIFNKIYICIQTNIIIHAC